MALQELLHTPSPCPAVPYKQGLDEEFQFCSVKGADGTLEGEGTLSGRRWGRSEEIKLACNLNGSWS